MSSPNRALVTLMAGHTFSTSRVTIYRQADDVLLISCPVVGSTSDRAEYRMVRWVDARSGWAFATECWSLWGLTIYSGNSVYELVGQNSAWEYAYIIGVAGDPSGAANWDFYGSVHGAQQATATTMLADGASFASLAPGQYLEADTVVISQDADIILPKDKTTVVGSTAMAWTITAANHIEIAHSHAYDAGYEIYACYSAMMPASNASGSGINQFKLGANATTARLYDGGYKQDGTTADTILMTHSSAHPFKLECYLPSGSPDDSGSWLARQTNRVWFHDDDASKGKAYVTWVDYSYSARIPAAASSHSSQYRVYV